MGRNPQSPEPRLAESSAQWLYKVATTLAPIGNGLGSNKLDSSIGVEIIRRIEMPIHGNLIADAIIDCSIAKPPQARKKCACRNPVAKP